MLKWKKKFTDENTSSWLEADTFYGKYCIESADINLIDLGSMFVLFLEQNDELKEFNMTFKSIKAAKNYAKAQFNTKLFAFMKKHKTYFDKYVYPKSSKLL